ncbi:MAG: GspH/FimT family pseudopilin [Candidatus Eisenbacteria bacterium]|uniref:GspH/FimT family pseudopilin n=1 Tax=Eiseniibacteriota bacterium TaxID=2212470 RepID=A0A933W8H3_UNCEI|nr:GspH/FimT family pseudopilin [Candidatus Eisenbacteria bacterium]
MPLHRNRGFSLVELMVAVAILGLMLTISVPGVRSALRAHRLKSSAENIAAQLRLARSTAMANGTDRRMCFAEDSAGFDYHVHTSDGRLRGWSLPEGIHYAMGTDTSTGLTFRTSGRASRSLDIVLLDDRAHRDSVTIEISGYLLVH